MLPTRLLHSCKSRNSPGLSRTSSFQHGRLRKVLHTLLQKREKYAILPLPPDPIKFGRVGCLCHPKRNSVGAGTSFRARRFSLFSQRTPKPWLGIMGIGIGTRSCVLFFVPVTKCLLGIRLLRAAPNGLYRQSDRLPDMRVPS